MRVRVDQLRSWAERAKSAQVALDLSKSPESVAVQAGQLQDLSEEILRVVGCPACADDRGVDSAVAAERFTSRR